MAHCNEQSPRNKCGLKLEFWGEGPGAHGGGYNQLERGILSSFHRQFTEALDSQPFSWFQLIPEPVEKLAGLKHEKRGSPYNATSVKLPN